MSSASTKVSSPASSQRSRAGEPRQGLLRRVSQAVRDRLASVAQGGSSVQSGQSGPTDKTNAEFVSRAPVDNFYQASSFYPMPFALITTVNEAGITSIGPHSLALPFGVMKDHAMMLITRKDSNTANNIRRSGRASLNFVEFNKRRLKNIVRLGYPGQTPEQKQKESRFRLVNSPNPERQDPALYPKLIHEAFQVYECTWDQSDDFVYKRTTTEAFFLLQIDNILLKPRWEKALIKGTEFPNIPISYGFRDGVNFWFTRHGKPFAFKVPDDLGEGIQSILYEANRIDPNVQFEEEAVKKLRRVPKIFLNTVLKGIVKEAKARERSMVTVALMEELDRKRRGRE